MANPFLVLGGIAVGIATAAFGILAVPGWVASAQDAAATNDIAQVTAAQNISLSESGRYATSLATLVSDSARIVTSGGVKNFTATDPTGKHQLTVSRSASGTYFARTSDRAKIGSGKTIEAAVIASGSTVTGPSTARVTDRGVRLPDVAAGLAEQVYENLHPNPNGAVDGFRGYYRWNGTSSAGNGLGANGAVTASVVSAPWSRSGTAVRSTWPTVAVDSGDFAVLAGDYLPGSTKATVRFRFVSNQDITLQPMRVWKSVNSTSDGRLIATSNPGYTPVKAGVPVDVWATVVTPEDGHAGFRPGFNIRGHRDGLTIDVSEADIYLGDYDPDRPWFSGNVAPEGLLVDWVGGTHNSTSRAYR